MARAYGSNKIRATYAFLAKAEADGRVFTFEEYVAGGGWAPNTARANLSKKLSGHVTKVDGGYVAIGVKDISEEAFCHLCSQNIKFAADPLRPRLAAKAEGLVIKARDAALAAAQHYNNPTTVFRSGNYIILMVIAITALLHAVFERDGVDYVAYHDDGRPKTVAGENMLWDLQKSSEYYAAKYTAKYPAGLLTAMTTNIRLMMPIRHKIEHRAMPPADAALSAYCQSMLTNFEAVMNREFTAYYSLNTSLALPLQYSIERTPEAVAALRRLHGREYDELKKYIGDFERGVPDDIVNNMAYAFRVYLVPKTANEARRSDISVEFVKVDPAAPQQAEDLARAIVAIKNHEVVGDPSKY